MVSESFLYLNFPTSHECRQERWLIWVFIFESGYVRNVIDLSITSFNIHIYLISLSLKHIPEKSQIHFYYKRKTVNCWKYCSILLWLVYFKCVDTFFLKAFMIWLCMTIDKSIIVPWSLYISCFWRKWN